MNPLREFLRLAADVVDQTPATLSRVWVSDCVVYIGALAGHMSNSGHEEVEVRAMLARMGDVYKIGLASCSA